MGEQARRRDALANHPKSTLCCCTAAFCIAGPRFPPLPASARCLDYLSSPTPPNRLMRAVGVLEQPSSLSSRA